MKRPARALGLLGLTALATLIAAPQTRAGRKGAKIVEVPAWVHEAAVREMPPAGLRDLIWLHDELEVAPRASGGAEVRRRIAARPLTAEGLRRLGSHAIDYRNDDTVLEIDAWTLLPDGTGHRADPRDDVRDLPATDGFSVYADVRSRVVDAPMATVGSVVAFETGLVRSFDTGAESFQFGDPDRPTAWSRFALRWPEGFSHEVSTERFADRKVETRDGAGGVEWVMREIPPLPPAELRPPARELLPVAWVHWWTEDGARGFPSWDHVGHWYHALSEPVLAEAGGAAEIAARLRPHEPEELPAKIAEAFGFVAREVRYVSIQIGIGGYKPASPAVTTEMLYGDCKAKSFLLRSILGAWGVESYPVLVRTGGRGPVAERMPSPGQFNHLVVAAVLPEGMANGLWAVRTVEGLGRLLFLDPTATYSAPWDLPVADQGTLGLVVRSDGAELVELPRQPAGAATTRRTLTASIDEAGGLVRASLTEVWSGSAAANLRSWFAGQSDRELRARVERDAQRRFPGALITTHRVEGLDAREAPVVETTELDGGRLGKRTGDLLVVEPALVGFGVVEVTLPPPPRSWPLDLGYAREEQVESIVEIPTGWKPESLPASVSHDDERVDFEGSWSFGGGRLVYRRTARLKTATVSPDDYPAFRKSIAELRGADQTAIVFVRGS